MNEATPSDYGAPDPEFDELLEMLKPLVAKELAMKRSLAPLDFAYWTLGRRYASYTALRQRYQSRLIRHQLVRALKEALRSVQELEAHPERAN
jgi:hypothetical protein